MPILRNKDSHGVYWRWGWNGKKYYVNTYGDEGAHAKAEQQAEAAHAHGYNESK